MNDAERIEAMRYELGRDAAQKGEPLHENQSEEFYHGYTDAKPRAWKGTWGGSSNVMPRLFGKGYSEPKPWTCICGYENPRYIRKNCWQCGVEKTIVDQAKE